MAKKPLIQNPAPAPQLPATEDKSVHESLQRTLAKLGMQMERQRPLHVKFTDFVLSWFAPKIALGRRVKRSPLFDEAFYLASNPDVAVWREGAPYHFANFGHLEGRDPSPLFRLADMVQRMAHVELGGENILFAYQRWLNAGQPGPKDHVHSAFKPTQKDDMVAISRHIGRMRRKPKIAVLMPVYNPDHEFLTLAIKSVQAQLYENWELCIADDASTDKEIPALLKQFAKDDPRIKFVRRAVNGHISLASNSALELVSAPYVAFMDQDDLLHETALYEVAAAISRNPKARMIYSDEDRIDAKGHHSTPYYKPDFNIELLLGQNFVSHLSVYETKLLRKLGGLRAGYEGSQDHDLTLRVARELKDDEIVHIPVVLYHWRHGGRKASFSERNLEKCVKASRAAIQHFLDLEGEGARVAPVDKKNLRYFSRVIRKMPEPAPLVSIIIPTRNKASLLATCVDGVLGKTDYSNFEVIIVDNDSDEPEALALLARYERNPRITVLRHRSAFNYSAINNRAARTAKGQYLALLNNDIEVIHSEWLNEMMTEAVREGVGAVGAKLFFPDGRLQHVGVLLGLGGIAGHALHTSPGKAVGYFGSASLTRAVSAVTAACLVVEKKKFIAVGGFDEKHLPVAFNDVDLCLKLVEAGYRNVWTPFARLVHHESLSRGAEDTTSKQIRSRLEKVYMHQRWAQHLANDRYYNPNLTLEASEYQLVANRRPKPWAKYL
ncbi:glycosyltransferase family 2 protein [Aestuariivirga litoralis]|uniref:glycosyltransferase family 2 protein n=1 Tax=Aestuariivirga litoralis TaxID=2650924 RepID=UPI0018C50F88|nr:glycosyltransferase family 2 protein [Aestuariivirga litoralis]MBG1232431.1 glycosyltransferase family 2 protein [Aestuariivirga litoralis]